MTFKMNQRVTLIDNEGFLTLKLHALGTVTDVGFSGGLYSGLCRVKFDDDRTVWLKESRLAPFAPVNPPVTYGDIIADALDRFRSAADALKSSGSTEPQGLRDALRQLVPVILTSKDAEAVLRALVGAK